MGVRVRTRGFDRARREVERWPDMTAEGARAVLDEWAKATRDEARALVPHQTGNLRRDIVTRSSRGGLTRKVGVWADDAFYAGFVEFGTSQRPAEPFLFPAHEINRRLLARGDEIRRRLE